MGAVHLRMMKLEGDGQLIPEPSFAIFPPDEEGVVEDAAVHPNGSVQLSVHNGGRTDDHTLL